MTLFRKISWMRLHRFAWAALIVAFIWGFQGRALKAHFGPDEMMNIYNVWWPPLWKVALANLTFWTQFVRPLSAIYYLPLFEFFRLNPVPYTIARIVLLAFNTVLFYKLARNLTGSWWVAVLASFPVAYQANLGNIVFDGAFIYDALCGTFFFAALLYYTHARRGRAHLSVGQTSIFLVLCICALDSKEMGVSVAFMAFVYELLYRPFARRPRDLLKQYVPTLAGGLLTLVYIVGKSTGAGSLTNTVAYRPVFKWAMFSDNSTRFFNTIFYGEQLTIQHGIAMWALLLLAGLIGMFRSRRDPRWLYAWIWVMVTPLPIAFLPDRGGALLYIACAGWGIAIAMMFRSIAWLLARHLFLGRRGRFAVMTACLLYCSVQYARATQSVHRYVVYGYLTIGKETAAAIQRLQELHLQPKPGSKIIFLHDPIPDTFDTTFISSLVWRDHSLKIWQQTESHLPEANVAGMDYIIDYADGSFVVLKQPPS